MLSPALPQPITRKKISEAGIQQQMLVSTEWLMLHLHDPDLVLLWVTSSSGSLAKSRIPGSRVIRLSDISVTREDIPNELAPVEQLRRVFAAAGVTDRSRIVIYGERYGVLAARAYFTLDYLGLAGNAALLNGGLEKWRAERRPQTNQPAITEPRGAALPLDEPESESVRVTTPEMQQLLHSGALPSSVALIDARPEDEYSGARLSGDVSKAGHLPGATSLYWMDLLLRRENPILLSDAELQQRFIAAGAAPGKTVITYCRSGMQSSFDYFVAKYLGYKVRMYDASFFEWSWDDLPVERSAK
ncbi:MAG: rhodanese-like domain-containing protein [Acidobacteriaceae bacterium]